MLPATLQNSLHLSFIRTERRGEAEEDQEFMLAQLNRNHVNVQQKKRPSLPLYLGTQRTFGGRPLMLKCRPSKAAHCSSLKSFFCLEQGSELQERNFIRRPTQYFPPFLGLGRERLRHVKRHPECLKYPFVRVRPVAAGTSAGTISSWKKNFQKKYPGFIYSPGKEKT